MDELSQRVADLEDKSSSKDDELLVLRSAIANLTRRLNACEEQLAASSGSGSSGGNANAAGSSTSQDRRAQPPPPATSSGGIHGRHDPAPRPASTAGARARPPVGPGVHAPSPGVSRRQLPVPGQLGGGSGGGGGSGRQPPPSPRQTATSLARVSNSPALSRRHVSAPALHAKPPASLAGHHSTELMPSPSMRRHGPNRSSGLRKGGSGSQIVPPSAVAAAAAAVATGPAVDVAEGTVRMFLRGRPLVFHAPSDYPLAAIEHPQKAPVEQLELEWVYGYRGRDCRNNLYVLASGDVVYFMAAVGVVLNRLTRTQRHYRQHSDDIRVMALHPNGIFVATGQGVAHDKILNKAQVRVWNSDTLDTLAVIGDGGFERGLCCVGFSQRKSGSLLFAVDESNDHILSVWDWNRGKKLTEARAHGDAILCGSFCPADDRTIVLTGKQHVTFWTLDGGKLTKRSGLFEKHAKPRYVTCLTFTSNHDLITGDSSGSILVWSSGSMRISQIIKNAHEGSILSLVMLEDGTLLSGGGKDRRIVAWDSSYQRTGDEYELPETSGAIRMLAEITGGDEDGGTVVDGDGPVILAGTTFNSIMEGSLATGFREIIKGHSDELWGLSVHPMQDRFVTAGFDKMVCCWDATNHDVVWSAPVADEALSVAVHPTGDIVVVGLKTGRWIIFDASSGTYITSNCDSGEPLNCLRFSPDGRMLAFGSHDSLVYLYTVSDDMKTIARVGKCSGHSSAVKHLDWSTDSQYIQTSSADYELLFWSAKTCKQVTSPTAMRDVIWATYTCPIGFPVIGIWPEGADGSDVNTVCRNSTSSMLATGDDFRKVKIFKYPLPQSRSQFREVVGHGSHVTAVTFTQDDTLLISAGGKDAAILQWQVLQPDSVI